MLHFRARLVDDTGAVQPWSRTVPTKSIEWAGANSDPAKLTLKASRQDFSPTTYPFLILVEFSIDGSPWAAFPEHELFIVEKDSDDSKDQAGIVSYEATPFVPWLLAGAYVGTGPWEQDGERTINGDGAGNANAGQIMAYFIDESKSRGWLTPLLRGFNATVDSAGAAWTVGDRERIGWRLETFYTRVLDQLTSQGLCEWSAIGRTLHMYRPGTRGRDRTELVLGGKGFDRVPVKTDATGWYTHVLGVYDGGRVHANRAPDETRFGRRSAVMSLTGVKDSASASRLASENLTQGMIVKREESYEWTPQAGGLAPFRDFMLGDHVTALSRGGRHVRRIHSIVITQQNAEPARVQVRVGEKISTLAARNQKRLGSVAVGGVQGGSGGAFPTSPSVPAATPAKVLGMVETSNVGSWGADGTAWARVGLSWAAVTADTDGNELTVSTYEVWSRDPAGVLGLETEINGTTADLTLPSGRRRIVQVRAKTGLGKVGEFSNELVVDPVMPASVVPKPPTGLIVVSNVGGWTPAGPIATVVLACDPVTESTDDAPATAAEYEWRAGDAPALRTPGPSVTVSVPSGVAREYRVLAITAAGVRGDLSDPEEVTGADPGTASRAPSAPILTSGSGVLVARWDGTYTGGGTVGALAVWVEARLAPGEWVRQGAALTGPGSQLVRIGSIGDDVDVRLVASDQLGRETGASAVVTAEILGIDGDDIIAGTFHGNRLIVGTVEADSLAPSVGEQLNLSANSAIVLMAGRLDDQETQITQTAQDLDVVRGDLDDAAQAASEAAAAAAVADGKAVVAQQRADNANSRMDDQAARFVVTPTGADVASLDAASIFRITPSGAQIIQGGTPASQWTAGQFIVSEAIVSRAQLGNHVVEKSGMRTVIRAL